MYSKAELEAKAHIELINIAKELGIPRATRMEPQSLIYKIIGVQSENPKALTKEQTAAGSVASGEDSSRGPRQKRARIKSAGGGRPAASSDPSRPTPPPQSQPQPESRTIDINTLVLPEVPAVPEVVSLSGRLLRSQQPAVGTQQPAVSSQQPAENGQQNEPQAEAPKRKRGRPRKNAVPETSLPEKQEEEADIQETPTLNSQLSTLNSYDASANPQQDTLASPAQEKGRRRRGKKNQEAVKDKAPATEEEKRSDPERQEAKPQPPQKKEYTFDREGVIAAEGVLEMAPEGFGYLRSSDYNYLASPDDIFIPQQMVRSYGLKNGDTVRGMVCPPRENDRYFLMASIMEINGLTPDRIKDRVPFESLTPLFPQEKFKLTGHPGETISTRIIDMFTPIGKGQRGLIVAQPKTGKTTLLKEVANAIAYNHPDVYLMVLLIDERPEEVTDMQRSVNAEVIASTFDEPADRHVRIANIVLEKAKRLTECGHDVVIVLDSITRLARAFNTVQPASGKVLSGGVEANALQKPKRFFGAARKIENGGSLTIIATALTETGSKMDDVIFEEFKGTGNMELQLDRKLANKRIYPAIDLVASSTRRDDLLVAKPLLMRTLVLRNQLTDLTPVEAMEFLQKNMAHSINNEEFLMTMDK